LVTCRSCGHQIADNAIVCYKCGTPTEMPAPAVKPRPSASRRPRWLVVTVFVGVVALDLWALSHTSPGTPARWAMWAILVLMAVAAVDGIRRR
jgi:hypothetical protein